MQRSGAPACRDIPAICARVPDIANRVVVLMFICLFVYLFICYLFYLFIIYLLFIYYFYCMWARTAHQARASVHNLRRPGAENYPQFAPASPISHIMCWCQYLFIYFIYLFIYLFYFIVYCVVQVVCLCGCGRTYRGPGLRPQFASRSLISHIVTVRLCSM